MRISKQAIPWNEYSDIGELQCVSEMSITLRQPSWVASTGLSEAAQSMSITLTISRGLFS